AAVGVAQLLTTLPDGSGSDWGGAVQIGDSSRVVVNRRVLRYPLPASIRRSSGNRAVTPWRVRDIGGHGAPAPPACAGGPRAIGSTAEIRLRRSTSDARLHQAGRCPPVWPPPAHRAPASRAPYSCPRA